MSGSQHQQPLRMSKEERREKAVMLKKGNKTLSSKRAALSDTTVVGNWTYVGDDGSIRQRRAAVAAAAASSHSHPVPNHQQKTVLEQTDGTMAVSAPQKPSSMLPTSHEDNSCSGGAGKKDGQLQIMSSTIPTSATTRAPPLPPPSPPAHPQQQSSRRDLHKNLVLESVQSHLKPGNRSVDVGGGDANSNDGIALPPTSRRGDQRSSAIRVLLPVAVSAPNATTATTASAATEGDHHQQQPPPPTSSSSTSRHSRTGRHIVPITDQHRYPVDATASLVVLRPISQNPPLHGVVAHTTPSEEPPHGQQRPQQPERDISFSSGVLHRQKSCTQVGGGGGDRILDDGSLSIRPLALQQQLLTTAPASPASNQNALTPPAGVDSVRRPSLMLQSIYGDDYTEVQVKDSVSPLSGNHDGRSPNSASTHSPSSKAIGGSKRDMGNYSGSMPLSGVVSSESWSRDTQLGSNNNTSSAMVVPTTTNTPRVVTLSSGPLAFAAPFSSKGGVDNSWLGDTSSGGGSRPNMSLYEVATPCYPSTNPSSKYQKYQHPRLLKLLRYRQRQLLKARRRAEKEKAVEEARATMFQHQGGMGEAGESSFLDAFGGVRAGGGDNSISGLFPSEREGPDSWMGGTNTTAPPGSKKGGGASRKSSLRTHYISSDALLKNAGTPSNATPLGRGPSPPVHILSSSCSDSSWASLYTTDSTDSDEVDGGNGKNTRMVRRFSGTNNVSMGDDEQTAAIKGRHPFHKIVSKYKSKKPRSNNTAHLGGNAALGRVIEDLSSKTGLLLESGRTVMDPSDLAALRDTTSRIRDASMKSKSLTQNANRNVCMTHPHRSDIVDALKTDFNMQNVLLTLEGKMPLTSEEEQLAYERVYYFASKHEKFRLPVSGGDPSSTAAATASMEARFLLESSKDRGGGEEDDEQARRSAAATARSRLIHNRVSVKKVVHDPPVTEINLTAMDAVAAVRVDDNAEALHHHNVEAMKNVVRRNRDRQRDMAAKKKSVDTKKEACEFKKGGPLMLVTRSKRQKRQIQMDTSARRLRDLRNTPLSNNNDTTPHKHSSRENDNQDNDDDYENWETASTNSSFSTNSPYRSHPANRNGKVMPDESVLSPLVRKDTAQGTLRAYAASAKANVISGNSALSTREVGSLKLPAITNNRSPNTKSSHVAKVPTNPKFTRYASISGGPAGGAAPVSMGLPNLSRGLDRVQDELQRNRRRSEVGGVGVLPVLASFHEANTNLSKALREASNSTNTHANVKGSFMSASRKADADQEMTREIDRVLIALKQRYAGLMTQPSTPATTGTGVNGGESAASLRAAEELRQEAWLLDALTMRCFDAFTSHVPYDVAHPPPLSTYKGLLQQMQKIIPHLSSSTTGQFSSSTSNTTTLPNVQGVGGAGGMLQSGGGSGLFSRKSSLRAVGISPGSTVMGITTPKNSNINISSGNFTKTNSASSGAWPVSESLTRKESAMGSSFIQRSESFGGVGTVSSEGPLSRQPSQTMGSKKVSTVRKGGLGWLSSQSAGTIANQASSLQILSLLSTAVREGWVDGNGSPIASKIVIDSDLISRANAHQAAQQKHVALQRPSSHVRQPGGGTGGVSAVGRSASIGRRLEELDRATNMIQSMRGRPPLNTASLNYSSSGRILSPNQMGEQLPPFSSGGEEGLGYMQRLNSGHTEELTTTETAFNTLAGGGGENTTPTNQCSRQQVIDLSIMSGSTQTTSNATSGTLVLGAHIPAPPAHMPREYGKFFLKGQQRAREYEHLKQQYQKHQDALFGASGNSPASSVVPTGSMPKRRGSVSPGATVGGGGVDGQPARTSRGMSVRFADDAFIKMGLAESGGTLSDAGASGSASSPSPLRPSAMSKKTLQDTSNLSGEYYITSTPSKLHQPPTPAPSKDDAIASEASKMLLQAMDGAPLMDRLQLRLRYGTIHPIHAIRLAPSDIPQELCGLVSECVVPSHNNFNTTSSLVATKLGSTEKTVSSATTLGGMESTTNGNNSAQIPLMNHWVLRATGASAAASKADTTTHHGISEDKVSVSDDFFNGGGPNYWVLPPRIAVPSYTSTSTTNDAAEHALSGSSRFDDADLPTSSRPTTKSNRHSTRHSINTVPVRVEYECRITTQQRSTAQSSSSNGSIKGLSTGSKLHHSVTPGVPNRNKNGGGSGGGAGSFTSKKVDTFHPLLQDSYIGQAKQGDSGGRSSSSSPEKAPPKSMSLSSPAALSTGNVVSQPTGARATSTTTTTAHTTAAMHTLSSAATAIIPTSAPSTRKNDASSSLSTGGSGIVLSTGPSPLLGPLTLATTLEKQRAAAASMVNIDSSLFTTQPSPSLPSPTTQENTVPLGAATVSNRSSTTFAPPEGLQEPPPPPPGGERQRGSSVGVRQQSVVPSTGGSGASPRASCVSSVPMQLPQQPPPLTKSSSISFLPTPPTPTSAAMRTTTTPNTTSSSKPTPTARPPLSSEGAPGLPAKSAPGRGKRPMNTQPFSPSGTLSGSSANPLSHFAASMLKQEARVRALVASTAADSCCNHYVQTVLCEKAPPSLAVRIHSVFAIGGVVAPSKRFYDHWCGILSETTGGGGDEESRMEMPVLSHTSPSVVMNSSSAAFTTSSSTFNNNTNKTSSGNFSGAGSDSLGFKNTSNSSNTKLSSPGVFTRGTGSSTRVGGGTTTRSGGTVFIQDSSEHPSSSVSGAVEGALIDAATTAIVRSSSGSNLVGNGGSGSSSSSASKGGLGGGGGFGSGVSLRRGSSFVYAKAPGQDSNSVASGLIGYGMGPSPSRFANKNRLSISNNSNGTTSVSAMMSYAASELHTDPVQIATFERIRSLEASKHVSIGGKVHLLDRNLDARKDYVAFLRESQRRAEEHHKLQAPNDSRLAPALLSADDFEQYTNPTHLRDRSGNRGTFNAAFEAFTDSKSVVGGDSGSENAHRRHPHPPAPNSTKAAATGAARKGVTPSSNTLSRHKQRASPSSSHRELVNPIENDPLEQTLRAGGAAGAPSIDQRRRDQAVSDTIQSILEQEAQSLTMAGLLNKMSINRRNDRLEEEGGK